MSDRYDPICQGPCGSVTMIDVFSLRLQARVRTDLKIQDERQRAKAETESASLNIPKSVE